jgi:hypothetical protein
MGELFPDEFKFEQKAQKQMGSKHKATRQPGLNTPRQILRPNQRA